MMVIDEIFVEENGNRGDRVSVIVPTFNRAQYINECIDSLLSQTIRPFEILIVDDGSDDDTAQRLARYGDQIQYIRKNNGGKASAVNLGLTFVQGDLVWLLDDDDVALPNAIATRLQALKENPGAGFAYSPHFLGYDGTDGRIVKGKLHETPNYNLEQFFFEIMKGCFFHFGTALVRKEVYDSIGPFDENLLRSQDYDFQIRMAQHTDAVFSVEPTFIFRQHAGERGPKNNKHSDSQRSDFFVKFDQLLGRKLRNTVNLSEYLIPRKKDIKITDYQLRRAYLSRMVVMSSKGCMEEMLTDLQEALKRFGADETLSKQDLQLIRATMITGHAYPAYRSNPGKIVSAAHQIKTEQNGRSALRCLALGMIKAMLYFNTSLKEKAYLLRSVVSLSADSIF